MRPSSKLQTAPRVRLCKHLKGKESSRIACWNAHIGVESRPKFVIETNIKFKSKAFLHKCEPSSQKRESNQQMEKGKNSGFEGIKELFYINLDP